MEAPAFDAPESEWLVYADALQEARDPRGEIISLTHAGKPCAGIVMRNAAAVLGDAAAPYVDRYRINSWRYCFIDSIDIVFKSYEDRDLDAVSIQSILASPCAAHVRTIRLVGLAIGRDRINLTKPMEVLAKCLPSTCQRVGFVDERAAKATMASSRDFQPTQLVTFGSFEPFFNAPNIEHLEVDFVDVDQVDFGTFDAPHLKKLVLRPLCFGAPEGESDIFGTFEEARWPELRDIELRLPETYYANIVADQDAYIAEYAESDNERIQDRLDEGEDGESQGTNWTSLEPLLQNLKSIPLQRLALTSCDTVRSLLTAISNVGLPATLKELDLSEASLKPDDVSWFERNKELLSGLERIILERTPLTDADLGRLAKIGPKIVWSKGPGAAYRYVVGSE